MKLLFFDTETTGIKPGNICQLSYITVDTSTKPQTTTGHNFFFTVEDVEPSAEAVHGFSVEKLYELSNGMYFDDLVDEFYNDFREADFVIGHNVSFDIKFLKHELEPMGEIYEPKHIFCTMNYFKDICKLLRPNGDYKNPKLAELVNFLNITDEEIAEEIELDLYKNKYEFFVPPLARWKMDTLPKNFEDEQLQTIRNAEEILANPNSTNQDKAGAEHDKDCAEKNLSFRGLLYENEDVGNSINIALKELEKSNGAILQGVLTGKEGNSTNFNETNTNGERKLPDEVLSEMIKDFNNYPLVDENFEFPDLMGAAYEFLIKYFAESAGKKGGEFYTPHQVVELMGRILKPARDAKICDPTVGSGGLLINMKNYVEMVYGSAKDLY